MKKFIIVDGPEKAGKSTLCEALSGLTLHSKVVHWGQIKPDDRVYAKELQQEYNDPDSHDLVIWDRSWASEYVYGRMLNRQRRGATNPWLLSWLHDRAIYGNGMRVMLLPNTINDLLRRRDDTDLPVDPAGETAMFTQYAEIMGWTMLYNDYTQDNLGALVRTISRDLDYSTRNSLGINPKYFACAQHGMTSKYILVIGEARSKNDSKSMAGAWLPFTSAKMTAFVQKYLGYQAFRYAWTNAEDIAQSKVPMQYIKNAHAIVAFGEAANSVLRNIGIPPTHKFAHPAYFSRWNTDRGRMALGEFESTYKEAFTA